MKKVPVRVAKQMLFIYELLEKTDNMERTQAQAWLDRITLKEVSPRGQRRSVHGCQDTWEGHPCLGGDAQFYVSEARKHL